MKINFSENFYFLLNEIIDFIAKDKPTAARKFKKDLFIAVKKDLKFPYNYKNHIISRMILFETTLIKVIL